jgi:hypothetical protein
MTGQVRLDQGKYDAFRRSALRRSARIPIHETARPIRLVKTRQPAQTNDRTNGYLGNVGSELGCKRVLSGECRIKALIEKRFSHWPPPPSFGRSLALV